MIFVMEHLVSPSEKAEFEDGSEVRLTELAKTNPEAATEAYGRSIRWMNEQMNDNETVDLLVARHPENGIYSLIQFILQNGMEVVLEAPSFDVWLGILTGSRPPVWRIASFF